MKRIFTYLLTLVLFPQCTKEEFPITNRGNLNQEIEIPLNQTVELTETNEGNRDPEKIRVNFYELNDNRCPMNAFCIRNGSAVVRLQLVQDNRQTKTIALVIGDALPTDTRPVRHRSADTTVVALGNNHYQVILKNITPYPCAGCPNQEVAKANIIVTSK